MSEDDVIAVLTERMSVPRETIDALRRLAGMIIAENSDQNLIASSTRNSIWDRHILDSAQLLPFAPNEHQSWLDVGTGAGFPGLVLAVMTQSMHILVEPRRRRAEFLQRTAAALGIAARVDVVQQSVERFHGGPIGVITARAVMSLANILTATHHLANRSTIWLLHKGRGAQLEVDAAELMWNAKFEMLPSMTAADASIVRVSEFCGKQIK